MEQFLLAGCVLLIVLSVILIYNVYKTFAAPKKRPVNIFDRALGLIYEAPEGAIQSVVVTLVYKTGAVVELKGPPDEIPTAKPYDYPFHRPPPFPPAPLPPKNSSRTI
jgi:hypothetical protein